MRVVQCRFVLPPRESAAETTSRSWETRSTSREKIQRVRRAGEAGATTFKSALTPGIRARASALLRLNPNRLLGAGSAGGEERRARERAAESPGVEAVGPLGAAILGVEIEGTRRTEQGARHIVLVRVAVREFELGREVHDALLELIAQANRALGRELEIRTVGGKLADRDLPALYFRVERELTGV